jgi:hypothetical protein
MLCVQFDGLQFAVARGRKLGTGDASGARKVDERERGNVIVRTSDPCSPSRWLGKLWVGYLPHRVIGLTHCTPAQYVPSIKCRTKHHQNLQLDVLINLSAATGLSVVTKRETPYSNPDFVSSPKKGRATPHALYDAAKSPPDPAVCPSSLEMHH